MQLIAKKLNCLTIAEFQSIASVEILGNNTSASNRHQVDIPSLLKYQANHFLGCIGCIHALNALFH